MNYAAEPAFAVVLYLNVKTSAVALTESALTAIKNGGSFYLPYLLDYDKAELLKAYPMEAEFFAKKKLYDPFELFTSDFYAKYSH